VSGKKDNRNQKEAAVKNLKNRKARAAELNGKRADLNPQSTETWAFRTVEAADRFRSEVEAAGLRTENLTAVHVLVKN